MTTTTNTRSATSADGTTIGYRELGQGRGIVLLHGAMESASSHLELAEALSDEFTVYLPDRRGRGSSGPHRPGHTVRTEVCDLAAVLAETGARDVFGVSAGALICLEAARTVPGIRRVVSYEPPLSVPRARAVAVLARYDAELARGDVAAAMVTGMKGAQMGPALLRAMPRWLLRGLTTTMMAAEERKAGPAGVTMRRLAPTLHYDLDLVIEFSDSLDRFREVESEVLLLGGDRSPAYLREALASLTTVLPHARRVELAGLDHSGSGNADRGGRPEIVATELRRFLAER
jgi:pimeloyl-ACP methyl ester carboxylesterase